MGHGLHYKKREAGAEAEAEAEADVGREDDLVLEKKNSTEDFFFALLFVFKILCIVF